MKDLEPLDPSYVQEVLSRPPFTSISGVINVRDLGGYPSITHPGKSTKPGFIYRSAEVASITDEGDLVLGIFSATLLNCVGKEQVRRLGIKTVFDLRSDTEIKKYNAPLPTIVDVELLHVPVFQIEDYSPEMMAK